MALEVKALLDELGLRRLAEDERLARHARATCASSRAGRSPRCGARRSRSRARSSGARRRSRPRSGGRRSATACSSTTTRTPRTAPPARRTRCARCPTRASRRRSRGTRCPTAIRRTSRVHTVPRALRRDRRSARGHRRGARARSRRCSSSRRATRRRASATRPWPPHFAKGEGEAPRVRPRARRRAARSKPRAKMPLIVVANSPSKDAALAGLERWKARHPEVGGAARGRRRARRLDARPLVHLDAHPREPAQRARGEAPAAGDARPRRRSDARVAKPPPKMNRRAS